VIESAGEGADAERIERSSTMRSWQLGGRHVRRHHVPARPPLFRVIAEDLAAPPQISRCTFEVKAFGTEI